MASFLSTIIMGYFDVAKLLNNSEDVWPEKK
jgi:hypothetical protein